MTSGPTDYRAAWTPRDAPQAASPAAPIEPIMLAIETFVAALSIPNSTSWSAVRAAGASEKGRP
jgi:hypothetical protein